MRHELTLHPAQRTDFAARAELHIHATLRQVEHAVHINVRRTKKGDSKNSFTVHTG